MAIDDSGEWWVGSEAADIAEYLTAYTCAEGAYPVKACRLIQCPCGSLRFRVARAAEVTRRVCPACRRTKFICRLKGDWEEAEAEEGVESYTCVSCGSKHANIAVGFAGYDQNPGLDAVKWFYVGLRCAKCGVLGCFNDGKVGRGPAAQVYRRA
jgi:hypothetical protein